MKLLAGSLESKEYCPKISAKAAMGRCFQGTALGEQGQVRVCSLAGAVSLRAGSWESLGEMMSRADQCEHVALAGWLLLLFLLMCKF